MIDPASSFSMPDDSPQALPRQVIVLERQSFLSQIHGVWFVAVPLALAFWICQSPYLLTETPPIELNLPASNWNLAASPKPAVKPQSEPESIQPEKPRPTVTKTIIAEKPAAKTQESLPPAVLELPKGVVVLNRPGMAANPVSVFDPNQTLVAQNSTKPHTQPDLIPTGDRSKPGADETVQALADIQKAAELAKNQRERDNTLKPLMAVHEAVQAEARQADRLALSKRRSDSTRQAFMENLLQILNQPGNVTQRSEQIEELRRTGSEGFDSSLYVPLIKKLEAAKRPVSTSTKIKSLRAQSVPEPIILAYLIQLEMRDIRKSDGPRDIKDAIVRSARLLVK